MLKKVLTGMITFFLAFVCLNIIATSVYGETLQPVTEVEVEMNDNYFNPEEIKLTAEKPVILLLKNNGRKPHTFTVNELNIDVVLQPGEQKNFTLKSVKKGTYELICRFHQNEGMTGKIIVE